VITGTRVVYPWYRDPAPDSPRSVLLADEATVDWHEFGMEWKEHVAWLSPILATEGTRSLGATHSTSHHDVQALIAVDLSRTLNALATHGRRSVRAIPSWSGVSSARYECRRPASGMQPRR
jgi:hypothetical protein